MFCCDTLLGVKKIKGWTAKFGFKSVSKSYSGGGGVSVKNDKKLSCVIV